MNRRSYYKWCKIEKPIANNFKQEISEIISEEHKNVKGIYGTIRLKKHIENKLKMVLNHKLIRRYKHILNLETIKRTKKGLSVSRAKEKNLTNKAQYLIECNFNSEKPGQKFSSDVSYIKCSDGTAISYKVNDTTTQDFYVLKDNGNTLDLITNDIVVKDTAWNISGNTNEGPMTILTALESVTNTWNNVNSITYNGTTFGNNGCNSSFACTMNIYTMNQRTAKARLITVQEATALGCSATEHSCPNWLFNTKNYQWTMGVLDDSTVQVWSIPPTGLLHMNTVTNNGIGARAVININK